MVDDMLLTINLSHYEKLYADQFERRSFEVRSKTQIFNSLQNHQEELLKGKRVLDVGFGSGDILLMLSRKGAECYGIEIVRVAIETLKCRHPFLHIFSARAAFISLKSDSFDIIICSHVLEHESNERAAISEMVRVLKPGGKIFLGVPAVAVGETELHACLYDLAAIKNLADMFHLEIIYSHVYGSRIFQIVYNAISAIAVKASTSDVKDNNNQNVAKYGIVRRLYHVLIVPFLLFLYRMDAILPTNKERPIEVWAILRKKI